MSQVAAVQIVCQRCRRTATTSSRAVLIAELTRYGWQVGKVTLCPECRGKG